MGKSVVWYLFFMRGGFKAQVAVNFYSKYLARRLGKNYFDHVHCFVYKMLFIVDQMKMQEN